MKYRINLLLPKDKNLVDKIIYFALNYLRYVLVITQIVVIGVFFYRFKVDQEIIDLKDELQQKQEIVAVSEPLIKEAQATDVKIKSIREVIGWQGYTDQSLDYILSIFPEKLTLINFQQAKESSSITMNGVTDDIRVLQAYYYRLKKESRFNVVELTNITKEIVGYSFSFKLKDFIVKSP